MEHLQRLEISRLTNLGPFLSHTFLNKESTEISDPQAEVVASMFMQSVELGCVLGLVGGTVLAIRKTSLRPLVNRWGYALGIFGVFPAKLYFSEISASENRRDDFRILRDRWAALGAATVGPLFVLFDAKFFAGAQLGIAAGVSAAVAYNQWKLQ